MPSLHQLNTLRTGPRIYTWEK